MPLLLLFAFTLFVSATLLFLVQPMIGKTLLPMLGGTPAVWNTCMVFFQALLLAGYAYAHATTTFLGARRQAVLHMAILALPVVSLGLTIDKGLLDYGEANPVPQLLWALLISVGLPFFVVSTSAPLLQKWFAGTGHPAAQDPYFLYGASNLGSMLALFGYPALVEPHLTLDQQRWLWRIGYGGLAGLTALCAVCLWRSAPSGEETRKQGGKETLDVSLSPGLPVSLSFSRRARWVLLAFVPSSLMLGATTYFTTDIAPIPLIWVLPLGLYLLSFILVFARLPGWVHRLMVGVFPYLVLPLVFLMVSEYSLRISLKLVLHLAVLFVTAMVCHGELARDRPPTRYLTGFYLWMSVGGVLGGLFNALAAPVVFDNIVEYPLVLVLACLLTPSLTDEPAGRGVTRDAGLLGFYLGAGCAFLIPALGRSDLTWAAFTTGNWLGPLPELTGTGRWMVLALVAGVGLVCLTAPADRDARAARWLDVGLPTALGVLFVGLSLGFRIRSVHQGLDDHFFAELVNAASDWSLDILGRHFEVPLGVLRFLDPRTSGPLLLVLFVLPVALCALFIGRPMRFGLGVGALFLASALCDLLNEDILIRRRSFFGAFRVNDDGAYRRLEHGTTLHGQQQVRWSRATAGASVANMVAAPDALAGAAAVVSIHETLSHPGREPLTYFHRTGPIGQILMAYETQLANRHIGLIGLGCGTLASYGQPGQRLTFYEIDPSVRDIAVGDHSYFSYVKDAKNRGASVNMVLGDARLKLEERAQQHEAEKFALLVCDAFSSDAIPIHLITSEAMKIFLDNLAEDGLLAFHISNRYLDLEPVLANLAAKHNLTAFIQHDGEGHIPGKAASNWVIMARQPGILDRLVHEDRWQAWKQQRDWSETEEALQVISLLADAGGGVHGFASIYGTLLERMQAPWRNLKVRPEVGVWTDDYSNLLRVFDWRN